LRKEPVPHGYNRIVVHAFQGPGDPNLQNRNISDFNRISSYFQPDWIKKEYLGFNNLELKSVNLVINHSDSGTRRLIYDCLDVGEFRRAFAPQRKDFYDVQTLLPLGAYGARPGKPQQACGRAGGRLAGRSAPIVLMNQQKDNEAQLSAFAEDFRKKTGLKLGITQPPAQKIVEMLHARKHDYNLAVVVAGTHNWDYDAFFEYYAGERSYYDSVPGEIKRLYGDLKAAAPEQKPARAAKLADELAARAMVLTLYQTSVRIYYPGSIKNFLVGRGFLETPEIGEFRW